MISLSSLTIKNLAILVLVLLMTKPLSVHAIDRECDEAYLRSIGAVVVDCNANNTNTCEPIGPGVNTGGTKLPDTVPNPWRDLINNAAGSHPTTDARMVATVLYIENNGWPEYRDNWATSGDAASGPFQFIPSTWAGYDKDSDGDGYSDIDGDRDGIADPNNPKDAVHAAFLYHRNTMGAVIASGYKGNAKADFQNIIYEEGSLLHRAGLYNGAVNFTARWLGENISSWPQRPSNVDDRAQNQNYIVAAYWLLASGFSIGYDYASFKLIDLSGAGNINLGTINTVSGGGCIRTQGQQIQDLKNMAYYSQCDPKWGNLAYGPESICISGCGPATMAMIFSTFTGDKTITPEVVAKQSLDRGHRMPNEGTAWSAFTDLPPLYNLKSEAIGLDMLKLKEGLAKGGMAIASMKGPGHFTDRGHIIVIRAFTSNGKVLVADPNDRLPGDPNYQKKSLTEWDASIIQSESAGFWMITK